VERRRLGESIEQHFISVGMLQGKFEITFEGLSKTAGLAESREEIGAGAQANGAENVVAVSITLVKSGSGCSGGLGDAAHGQGLFTAAGPKAAGGIKNTFF
jgi:hypothetical protein